MASYRELLRRRQERDPRDRARGRPRRASATPRSSTCASRTSTSRARSPARCSSPAATSRARPRTSSPTATQPIVIYCAGGNRSAFAAKTLAGARLHRRRVDGRRLRPLEERGPAAGSRPRCSPPSSATATAATSSFPRSARPASRSCSRAKVLLLGAGGLGSPAALYLAAAGVGTLGIVDMDVVDASNLQRQILHNMDRIGERKVDSAKKTLTAAQPRRRRRHLRRALRRRQRARHHRRLRRHRRRHRQLPDALPAQRRVAAEAHPGRARLDLPLRGPGHGVRALRRARATAACCPSRRRPSSRRAARRPACSACCPASSARSRRSRRSSCILDLGDPLHRPAARVRRARGDVPHVQGAARPAVPGVRRGRGTDRDRRVRRALPARTPCSPTAACWRTDHAHRRSRATSCVDTRRERFGFPHDDRERTREHGDDAQQRVVAPASDPNA